MAMTVFGRGRIATPKMKDNKLFRINQLSSWDDSNIQWNKKTVLIHIKLKLLTRAVSIIFHPTLTDGLSRVRWREGMGNLAPLGS